jgi:hypothetical protein
LRLLVSRPFAFWGTVWFYLFHQDFYYTYNHIGGILCILAVTYFLLRYLKDCRAPDSYLTLFFIFLLCLIKINFGLTALFLYYVMVLCAREAAPRGKDTRFQSHIFCGAVLLSLVAVIYFYLIRGLPLYEIRQCLPYLSSDHPQNVPLAAALKQLTLTIYNNISSSPANICFAVVINLSVLQTLMNIFKLKPGKDKKFIILSLIFFILFYTANLHEYLKSAVHYRMLWSEPFKFLLMFTLQKSLLKPRDLDH